MSNRSRLLLTRLMSHCRSRLALRGCSDLISACSCSDLLPCCLAYSDSVHAASRLSSASDLLWLSTEVSLLRCTPFTPLLVYSCTHFSSALTSCSGCLVSPCSDVLLLLLYCVYSFTRLASFLNLRCFFGLTPAVFGERERRDSTRSG